LSNLQYMPFGKQHCATHGKESMSETQAEKWYLRYHDETLGPFPSVQIARYLQLQRLKAEDKISRDREHWYSIRDVAEVWPEKRLSTAAISDLERQQLQATQRWVDEHPSLFVPLDEARGGAEAELMMESASRAAHQEEKAGQRMAGYVVAAGLALMVIVLAFVLPRGKELSLPQCDAPAAPGVNWSNCRMQGNRLENADLHDAILRNSDLSNGVLRAANLTGTDLAYANLSQANLRGANLSTALLTGASLRRADLQSANLQNADLSYADLTGANIDGAVLVGAKLGNTILSDEIACMPESVGRCIPGRR
jgi:hypothetical protein